jgi:hypothetical protein
MLDATVHLQDSTSNTELTAEPATTAQPVAVNDGVQPMEISPYKVTATPATTQLEPVSEDVPKINPYAEIAIDPGFAEPLLAAVGDDMQPKGSNPYAEILVQTTTSEPITDSDTENHESNPCRDVVHRLRAIAGSSSADDHPTVQPFEAADHKPHSKRRMSLDPRVLQSTGTGNHKETEVEFSQLDGLRSKSRLGLGARLFLKSLTAGSGTQGSKASRRLSLGIQSCHRVAPADGNGESDAVDLLASLRSSGVSFPTNNTPRLRKRVAEAEVHVTHSRRRMSVGARFFRRTVPTDEHQTATDGGHRRRRMSVGARFLHRSTAAGAVQNSAADSKPHSLRRRMSMGARIFKRTPSTSGVTQSRRMSVGAKLFRKSSTTTSTGDSEVTKRRMSAGARLFQQIPATIPEDGVETGGAAVAGGGTPRRSWRKSLGALLLSKLTIHEENESPEGAASGDNDTEANERAALLATLRSTGVSFPTK